MFYIISTIKTMYKRGSKWHVYSFIIGSVLNTNHPIFGIKIKRPNGTSIQLVKQSVPNAVNKKTITASNYFTFLATAHTLSFNILSSVLGLRTA